MMLEALYDLFFEPFMRDKLKYDLEHQEPLSGAEYAGDNMRAKERLKSFRNYIGKKK